MRIQINSSNRESSDAEVAAAAAVVLEFIMRGVSASHGHLFKVMRAAFSGGRPELREAAGRKRGENFQTS